MKTYFILLSVIILVSGCEKLKGDEGPPGESGTALLHTYKGVAPEEGFVVLEVPELRGRIEETFVMCYWAFSDYPDDWILMTDGWADGENVYNTVSVNWDEGIVILYGVLEGNYYMVQVFENN